MGNGLRIAPLAALLAGILAGGTPGPAVAQETGFQAWVWMHARESPAPARLRTIRDLGFTGVNASGAQDLEFLAEVGLAFYQDDAVGGRILRVPADRYETALEAVVAGSGGLVRPWCLRDPAVTAAARERIASRLAWPAGQRAVFVSLGDELSYTHLLDPIDWCHAPACEVAFGSFLTSWWGSERLARAAWNLPREVPWAPVPELTENARRRFVHGPPDLRSLVPWHDTRAFADATFAEAVETYTGQVRELAPGLPVGFLGGQMPSAFGGFDWSRLLRSCEVVEPYDNGANRALVGGLARRDTWIFETIVVANETPLSAADALWRAFLLGDRGIIVYSDEELLPEGKAGPIARALAPLLAEIAQPQVAAWMHATPVPPQVAILESMPNVRLHWMLDTARDGASWIRRRTSYENAHSSQARTRASWSALIQDLGLPSRFVTPAILNESLDPRSLPVLVLPRQLALSDTEATAITTYVRRGGMLISDSRPGLFTSRLVRRETGILDPLLGITRSPVRTAVEGLLPRDDVPGDLPYPVVDPDLRTSPGAARLHTAGAPVFVEASGAGSGRALYLNLDIATYATDRLRDPTRSAWLLDQLRPYLLHAGIRPRIRIQRDPAAAHWPLAVELRQDEDAWLLAVRLDLSDASLPMPWEELLTAPPIACEARLWEAFTARDLRTGKDLGRVRSLQLVVGPGQPTLLRLSTPADEAPGEGR